jgi:hypothetical protein
VVTPEGQRVRYTRDEFAAYVETVFRHQNQVTNRLVATYAMSDDPDPTPDPAVLAAEQAMVRACRHLNDTITAYIDGDEPGLGKKLALVNTIAGCDAAAYGLEEAIASIERAPPDERP